MLAGFVFLLLFLLFLAELTDLVFSILCLLTRARLVDELISSASWEFDGDESGISMALARLFPTRRRGFGTSGPPIEVSLEDDEMTSIESDEINIGLGDLERTDSGEALPVPSSLIEGLWVLGGLLAEVFDLVIILAV